MPRIQPVNLQTADIVTAELLGSVKKELDELIRLVGLTKDNEISCQQCLALVAEFAEQAMGGKSLPEGFQAVEHHLAICGECREEYEALQRALQDMDG